MTLQRAACPLLIPWELTRAGQLACRYCRAEAVPRRHPRELATNEGFQLPDALHGFGYLLPPLVLPGGNPLARPDLFKLIAGARERGFAVSITSSGTSALTPDVLRRLREAGITTLALSLDGSTAERHDSLRGVEGSFVWTLTAARTAREPDFPVR